MGKPTARELQRAADVAQTRFWDWLRIANECSDSADVEAYEALADAMNRLTGIVEARR